MTDIWVCSNCHSINRQRVTRCYKCGGSRDEATGEGSDLRVEQALMNRTVVSYRSARLRAVVAAILILAVAALGVVILLARLDDAGWMRGQLSIVVNGGQLDRTEFLRRTAPLIVPGLARLGLAIGAVLFFAAWLSRVTMNIPALGGGIPRTTPTRAFIYPLIPLWNLIKVPGMIQDALYRVDPTAGGFFMLALAWFGLVGSWLISFSAGWVLDSQLASALAVARTATEQATALQRWFDVTLAVGVVTELMVAAGAVVLVVIMARIERRSAARDREIQAAALAPPGAAGIAPPASPEPVPSATDAAAAPTFTPVPGFLPFAPAAASAEGPGASPLSSHAVPAPKEPPWYVAPPATEPPVTADLPAAVAVPEVPEPAEPLTEAPAPVEFPERDDTPPEEPEEPAAPEASQPDDGTASESATSPDATPSPEATPSPAQDETRVGPHLDVVVHGDGRIVATVDADPEQITLEELAMVADALAQAAGTAVVTAADDEATSSGALEAAAGTLRDHGVATTTAPVSS